jgi:Uncharacterized protein conserved in bacteria (DUF2345)
MSIDPSLPQGFLTPPSDINLKLPFPPNPLGRATGFDYPMISGETKPNGHTSFWSQFGDAASHFSAEIGFTGAYKVIENGAKKIIHSLENAVCYNYVKGRSHQNDGNDEHNCEGSTNNNTKNDHACKAGGDSYHGAGGHSIGGAGNCSFNNNTGGSTFEAASGDHVKHHDGHNHTIIKGDEVHAVAGNKYHTVKGDHGHYVQSGNYDIKVESGKTRFEIAQNLSLLSHDQVNINADGGSGIVNISAANKIILQVGGSSITITPDDITINSGGTVNIKGSGDIITKGQTTKLQGGGPQVVTEAGPSSVVFAKV